MIDTRMIVVALMMMMATATTTMLTFQPAHIIRDSTLDETRLTVIIPLSERRTDIATIRYCFSRDTPFDARRLGCESKGYEPIDLSRIDALVDDARALRFTVPYWEGRNDQDEFYNPIVYVEVRDSSSALLACGRVHVDPPDKSSLLTITDEEDELAAPKQNPQSVMWIGVSLFVVAAGLVAFGLMMHWRRNRPFAQKNRADTLEGAIALADEADWYHKM